MSAIKYDLPTGGLSGPIPIGPPAITFPLAPDNNYARVYHQPFLVHSGVDQTGAMGSPGLFPGTILAFESDRLPIQAGFSEFSRQYAEIPSGFSTYDTHAYVYPGMNLGGSQSRLPTTKTVVSRVQHDFFNASPQSIPISGAQLFLYAGITGFDVISLSNATQPTAVLYSGWITSGVEMVAEDSTIARYVGPIWERQTRFLTAK
jgi:hypothetical protein